MSGQGVHHCSIVATLHTSFQQRRLMMTPTEFNDAGMVVIDSSIAAFRSNKGWADKAIAQLPDAKLHVALDANTNNIAVIIKHVAGNLLSRWTDFLTTDGEKPWRNRDDEFVDTFKERNVSVGA